MPKPIKFKKDGGIDLSPIWDRQNMFKLMGWIGIARKEFPLRPEMELPEGEGYEFALAEWIVAECYTMEALQELEDDIHRWFAIQNGTNVIRIEEMVGLPKDEIDRKYGRKRDYGNVTVEGREHFINTEDGPRRNEQEDWD